MKPQFQTKTILLFTAVVAILCGGVLADAHLTWKELDWQRTAVFALVASPTWLPLAFLAFAIGRRRLSVEMVLLLAIGEAAALGASHLTFLLFSMD
jgi:hypothetical protein